MEQRKTGCAPTTPHARALQDSTSLMGVEGFDLPSSLSSPPRARPRRHQARGTLAWLLPSAARRLRLGLEIRAAGRQLGSWLARLRLPTRNATRNITNRTAPSAMPRPPYYAHTVLTAANPTAYNATPATAALHPASHITLLLPIAMPQQALVGLHTDQSHHMHIAR
jgi:hypothetical protein